MAIEVVPFSSTGNLETIVNQTAGSVTNGSFTVDLNIGSDITGSGTAAFQTDDLLLLFHSVEQNRGSTIPDEAAGNTHNTANFSPSIRYGALSTFTSSGFIDLGYSHSLQGTSRRLCVGAYALVVPSTDTLQNGTLRMTYTGLGSGPTARTCTLKCFILRGVDVSDFASASSLGVAVARSSASTTPDNDGDMEWVSPTSGSGFTSSNYTGTITQFLHGSVRRNGGILNSGLNNADPEDSTNNTVPTSTLPGAWEQDTEGTVTEGGQDGSGGNSSHRRVTYFNTNRTFSGLSYPYAFRMVQGSAHSDTNSGGTLSVILREDSTSTVETASVTGSYSVQNSDSVQGDYGVQASSPVTASYSVQVSTPVTASYSVEISTPVTASYSVEVSAPVSGSYSVQASASVSASYSVEVSTEVTASYSVQVSTPVSSSYSVQVSTPVSADYSVQTTLSNQVVANYGLKSSTEVQSDYSVLVEESVSADYFVETTPTAQVAADYGVQSSTNVQSDYGVRVEKSVSSSYDVQSSAAESTQVSASYALQVSDDVQADYGVKVSSEVAASYGLQVSPDVTADYSVQRILSDQVDSDYAVRNSSPVSASYSLTFSRDVLGDYGVQSESTVQSDYAIANSTEIGASYAVDDGITNASVTLLDSIPIQSVGTAQTTLSFSAIGQSQFAGQSLVIALVGVGEFRAGIGDNWDLHHPFFIHSPSMDEVTNTLSTNNSTPPEFVHSSVNQSLSEGFCYLAYRQIQASDTFKTYDVTVDIPANSTGNFVGGVLLRVNNGVIPSSWPKHRNQLNLTQGIAYTTPAQNYDANSLILNLIAFHNDESGGVVTPEKGIEELYQSNVVNKGGQSSPRGLIAEEPVGDSALTNRSQVFTLPNGLAPPSVQIVSFNFEIQVGETQTHQVSAEYVVQGASTTSVITGSYGVGGTDTATATYSVQTTDSVAVGSDYAVKPEAAVSADYAVTTSDQVAGDYALQVQQPVSGSYGVTNSEEVDGDYAVLNSRIVTANYLVATANVEFSSVTASYGVTAETEVGATYGVGQSAQVDADYAVLNEPSVSADYGVQVQSPVSASYALQATESVGATFSVKNTQAVESDYAVKNSEQVTGEYLVQQLDVQGQVSASYDVGVPQIRNIGASYAVSGQTTVNQETVLGEYVVRNDAYVAEKALRQLGYLKQRTK